MKNNTINHHIVTNIITEIYENTKIIIYTISSQ